MSKETYYSTKPIHISIIGNTFPRGTAFTFYNRDGKDYVMVNKTEYDHTIEFDILLRGNRLTKETVEYKEIKPEPKKLYEVVKSDEDAMDREIKIADVGIEKKREAKKSNKMEIIREQEVGDVRGMSVVKRDKPKEENIIRESGIKITMSTSSADMPIIADDEGTVVRSIGKSENDTPKEDISPTKVNSKAEEAKARATARKAELAKKEVEATAEGTETTKKKATPKKTTSKKKATPKQPEAEEAKE